MLWTNWPTASFHNFTQCTSESDVKERELWTSYVIHYTLYTASWYVVCPLNKQHIVLIILYAISRMHRWIVNWKKRNKNKTKNKNELSNRTKKLTCKWIDYFNWMEIFFSSFFFREFNTRSDVMSLERIQLKFFDMFFSNFKTFAAIHIKVLF